MIILSRQIGIESTDIEMNTRSPEQMAKLLDLLSEDGLLVNGRISYKRESKLEFWKRIADELNAIPGAFKDAEKWCKVWVDMKDLTKRKAKILSDVRINGDSSIAVKPLSGQETRLLKLIGYHSINNQLKEESVLDKEMDVLLDYNIEEDENKNEESDEGSEDSEIVNFKKDPDDVMVNSKHENGNVDGENSSETSDDHPLVIDKKQKGRQLKRKRLKANTSVPFDKFKTKVKFSLEKEKVQQKHEELRLKALELKLKGDELKLMELEMKKLNHLTSIEEEKLTCFKDMSAMLKELVEKSRTGSLRFPGVE